MRQETLGAQAATPSAQAAGQEAGSSAVSAVTASAVADREVAEGYVAKVCFKTGPPSRVGVELEWILHHRDDPGRPLDPDVLIAALGDHAPHTLRPGSPGEPLPRGGAVTVEPGGQVEISTPPATSLSRLLTDTAADIEQLTALMAAQGLTMGGAGADPHRQGRRILHTPRYDAMERAFTRRGLDPATMMSGTAGLQVCLDAGAPDRVAARWTAAHLLGPVMVAVFANSRRSAGADTGWASARMRAWFPDDPRRAYPSIADPDPVRAWSRQVLDTPLLCLRREGASWDAPEGVTFADWIAGALPDPPTFDDLDYHLTMMFPPVRARGYLEIRYLDTQPGDGWLAPAGVLAALFADEDTVDRAAELAAPAADRWMQAARDGLADPVLRRVAPAVLDLACRALTTTDLPETVVARMTAQVERRLHTGGTA